MIYRFNLLTPPCQRASLDLFEHIVINPFAACAARCKSPLKDSPCGRKFVQGLAQDIDA